MTKHIYSSADYREKCVVCGETNPHYTPEASIPCPHGPHEDSEIAILCACEGLGRVVNPNLKFTECKGKP